MSCCTATQNEPNKPPLLALARRYRQRPNMVAIGNVVVDTTLVSGAKYGIHRGLYGYLTENLWKIYFIDDSYFIVSGSTNITAEEMRQKLSQP